MKNLTPHATINTDKWDINIIFYDGSAPLTVANFITLARRGYYDGLNFHRVIEDFMIQGGCPTWDGTWGPGYHFEDEFDDRLKHDTSGILSMANSWPGTNGSQFFITHVPTPWLDWVHTIFGRVVDDKDQNIVNSIDQWDKIKSIIIHDDQINLSEAASQFADEINQFLDSLE